MLAEDLAKTVRLARARAAGAGRKIGIRRNPAARAARAVLIAHVLTALALTGGALAGAAPAAQASGTSAQLQRVSYRGYHFEVPRSWPVIHEAATRGRCVRFDEHAIYLGRPSINQTCPSWLVGTTEAVLVEPGPVRTAASSVEDPTARAIHVTARRITLTATFDNNPTVIYRILASAGLPPPVIRVPNPARLARAARPGAASSGSNVLGRPGSSARPRRDALPELPAVVANRRGLGFDSCAAPSAGYMRAWLRSSPYRAVGIYIGGSDRACDQLNLTAGWVRDQAMAGWSFIPLYAGPQAAFGEISRSNAASEGTSAAADAVVQAERLGFGPRTPIYYDMEAYPPSASVAALRFLSAWTRELRRLNFVSGVYSSSGSGIADLAGQYRKRHYQIPDVIYDALWNGKANTRDGAFRHGEWTNHRRLHQYSGNVTQTFGGDTIDIDQDYLNVLLASPGGTSQATSAVTRPDGTIEVFYRGADGQLWREVRWPGAHWRPPVNMGRVLSAEPSAVCVGADVVDVFYRGAHGNLLEVSDRAGSGWGRPVKLTMMGILGGAPRAVAQPNGVIDVFWRGSADDHLWHGEFNPGRGWTGPQELGGSLASYPSPVESSPGRVSVFWQGTDDQLWHVVRRLGGHWSRPESLGMGPLGSSVHATAQPDGSIEVFWQGTAPHQVWGALRGRGGRWSGPRNLGGRVYDTPWPVTAGGAVRVLWRGPGSLLWMSLQRARRWAATGLGLGRLASAPFAAVGAPGDRLNVFWKGRSGELWWAEQRRNGTWRTERSLGGQLG